ncbi:methylated-DNA--[protein]-cysteine S-methyltransferase [Periweissella cryptocerci]|uniref:methylated-DNA--[protein]-cysteine S-methyltransferase n=2 Tax=Periweissella cryptocerci TaxID=2506420 RepID=A0A4P6YX92_9LACO|nr:methylated-DNA--[protein]-cysteine S-methyltransferase [Periweissella cryptocerci]
MRIETEFCPVWVAGVDDTITQISFTELTGGQAHFPGGDAFAMQVTEYLAGARDHFELNTEFPYGTAFQKQVWQAMQTIPYGETRTYKEIATLIGSPKAQQAVGQAAKRNPLPFVYPCHRIMGANGKLTGFFGNSEYGLDIKKRLALHEQKSRQLSLFA